MKFLPILWTNLRRRKLRTGFTLASVVTAFVLFGLLSAIENAFDSGVEIAGQERLMVMHRVSITQFLPIRHAEEIRQIEGVDQVSHATWFGGVYRQPSNFFPQFAVAAEEYLAVHDEIVLSDEEREAWLADTSGAVVGSSLARRFGWSVGDRIPLRGTIWTRADGSDLWELTLRGIYRGREQGVDTGLLLFHYDLLEQARSFGQGMVSFFEAEVTDASRADEIATTIDAKFANSPFETATTTAAAFAEGFANQVGNVGALTTAILSAVFFIILVVSGTTMMQSIRERRSELATLKALGFDGRLIAFLVLAESLLITTVGGLLGLAFAALLVAGGDPTGGALPNFGLGTHDLAFGLLLLILAGLAAGAVPALEAVRMHPAPALRRL